MSETMPLRRLGDSGLQVSRTGLALSKPSVTAPILGATGTRHLDEALPALEIETLDAPYTSRLPVAL